MPGLLVSLRSAAEARAAFEAGADLLDIKEPRRGSLGRASDATIRAILGQVGGARPVSAAFGELVDRLPAYPEPGLAYAKWGLAGCGGVSAWPVLLRARAQALRRFAPACSPVAVAYADWVQAAAPRPHEVCRFACEHGWVAMLVDTHAKDGRTLLDWISIDELLRIRRDCRDANVRLALAGSLGELEIHRLRDLEPDWFAVRGSVCRQGKRGGVIDPVRVRRLVRIVHGSSAAATIGS